MVDTVHHTIVVMVRIEVASHVHNRVTGVMKLAAVKADSVNTAANVTVLHMCKLVEKKHRFF